MNKKRQLLVAIAIIFDENNRILLSKRHNPKNLAVHNKWQLPGGEVEHGEHPLAAAIREIQEELQIAISPFSEHPILYSYVFPGSKVQLVLIGYPAQFVKGEINITGDNETSDAKWFDAQEIDFTQTLRYTKEFVTEAMKIVTKTR